MIFDENILITCSAYVDVNSLMMAYSFSKGTIAETVEI